MSAPATARPLWGIRFADGETSWVGTREQADARYTELESLAAKGVVKASTITGMEVVPGPEKPPGHFVLEEQLLEVLISHRLVYDQDGDGWQEPLSEESSCSCGNARYGFWQQTDPEHTGYQKFQDTSETRHHKHQARLLAAAATLHRR